MKIGSRESKLAVIQANEIMSMINKPCELITMKTTGDIILDRTLDKVGGKGLFVKELDKALMSGQVDLTVHSLKDVPMELSNDYPIIAFSKREDARDVLVLPNGKTEFNLNGVIGCSSLRRTVQLKKLFKTAKIKPIRGNIQTRLKKLDDGEYDALVLAAAGLHRLGLKERIHKYFSFEEILPAAGQGILAVQGKANKFLDIISSINDENSMICATAERAFIKTLNGGCFAPIGVHAIYENNILNLRAMYSTNDNILFYDAIIKEVSNTTHANQIGIDLADKIMKKVKLWQTEK